jgi:cation diffusion facilitator family transporter
MALIGLGVNAVLCLVKLLAGILGHSGALVADAVESIADVAGSAVIWGGLRIGAVPPDEDHPYGHGKAEALAALVVAALLACAGVGILAKAVHDVRTPHENPAPFTLWVLVLVVGVKAALFVRARAVARREGSGAVEVDAWHHVSDAITSAAAFVGISIALFGARLTRGTAYAGVRWETADDWAALLAALIILYNSALLARGPLRELMDATHPDDDPRVAAPARDAAMGVPGVRAVEKLRARRSGSGYWLDMHVQVDPALPIREAHAIGGRVRATVRAKVPAVRDVLIHMEPYEGV